MSCLLEDAQHPLSLFLWASNFSDLYNFPCLATLELQVLPLVSSSLCSDELDVLEANSSLWKTRTTMGVKAVSCLFLPGTLRRQLSQKKEISKHIWSRKKKIMFLKRCLAHTAFYSRNKQVFWLTRPHESFQMAPVKPRTIGKDMF